MNHYHCIFHHGIRQFQTELFRRHLQLIIHFSSCFSFRFGKSLDNPCTMDRKDQDIPDRPKVQIISVTMLST